MNGLIGNITPFERLRTCLSIVHDIELQVQIDTRTVSSAPLTSVEKAMLRQAVASTVPITQALEHMKGLPEYRSILYQNLITAIAQTLIELRNYIENTLLNAHAA